MTPPGGPAPSLTDLLDPELAPVIAAIPFFTLDADNLALVRSGISGAVPEPSGAVESTDHLAPGAPGDPPVAVRVHRPVGVGVGAGGPLPCIVSMHGGGYVVGSHRIDDPLFDRWSPELGIVGVAVDYRLAPETPYPGPLEDCYAALRWVHDNADELGIDPAQVGLHGLSAGGGLAAALALLARDRGELPVAFQALASPMLDDRQLTPSNRLDGLPVWNRDSNAFGWRSYLGDLYGRGDVPAHAAPARAVDLTGLPPAFVSVGALDGFRDEDVDYALRLNQAGVPTELHLYPGAPHGYQVAAQSNLALRSLRDLDDWLSRQLR
jgi:acetyl esterase/lipase